MLLSLCQQGVYLWLFVMTSRVKLSFFKQSGERLDTRAIIGDSMLDVVVDNDLDIDGFG